MEGCRFTFGGISQSRNFITPVGLLRWRRVTTPYDNLLMILETWNSIGTFDRLTVILPGQLRTYITVSCLLISATITEGLLGTGASRRRLT